MNDFLQYTNRLQFHFWSIFCGQKVNFKWRSYQADRPTLDPSGRIVIRDIRVFYWTINRSIVLPGQMTDHTWFCDYMLVMSVENSDILFNFLHS